MQKNNFSQVFKLSYSLIALLLLVTLKPIGHTEEGRLYDFKPMPFVGSEKPTSTSCFSSDPKVDSLACLLNQSEREQSSLSMSKLSGDQNEFVN